MYVLGHGLIWALFFITEIAQIFGILFYVKGDVHINGLSYILDDFFVTLIWSPWRLGTTVQNKQYMHTMYVHMYVDSLFCGGMS
jgi:hypothetical protein